jgi:ankyrin repeat protein
MPLWKYSLLFIATVEGFIWIGALVLSTPYQVWLVLGSLIVLIGFAVLYIAMRRIRKGLQPQLKVVKEKLGIPEAGLFRLARTRLHEKYCRSGEKATPLLHAVWSGDKRTVKQCLKRGYDIHFKDESSQTALYWAAYKGSLSMVKLLLDIGACADIADEAGITPLHIAAHYGDSQIAEALISNDTDTERKDIIGQTPLHKAAQHDIAPMRKNRLPSLARVVEGLNKVRYGTLENHHLDHDAAALTLIYHGADVMATDTGGNTPLHMAATGASEKTISLFLDAGADVNAKNDEGWTPLHFAAENGCTEVFDKLIASGADVKTRTVSGETVLHCLAKIAFGGTQHRYIIPILLSRGLDINAKDREGHTPLHHATGCAENDKDIATLLIMLGADISATNNAGETLLHRAAGWGNKYLLELLIEKGVKVEAADSHGATPLHHAVRYGTEKTVQALLENGANVNAVTSDKGQTPLHAAIDKIGYIKKGIVAILLDDGADVNAVDSEGKTALHYVLRWGYHRELAEMLLDRGADVELPNAEGKTPLDFVSRSFRSDFKQLVAASH